MTLSTEAFAGKSAGFYLHIDSAENIDNLLKEKISEQLKKPDKNLAIITGNQGDTYIGIPYLTVHDVLFLGLKRRQRFTEEELASWATHLNLPDTIFKQKFSDISMLDAIKLQLLKGFMQNKQVFFLSDVFADLSTQAIQELLALLHQLAHGEALEILCCTTNQAISKSNYIDQLF